MSLLQCPNCDSKFKVDSGWAKTAITMMIPAPVVSDMATQARCPTCHHLFTEGEIRYLTAPVSKSILLVAALAVASVVI